MLHLISRNDGLPKGISSAHVTVYEGGKGKPPPAPPPMLLLAGPKAPLAPVASNAVLGDSSRTLAPP
jgi:hypothetical protein